MIIVRSAPRKGADYLPELIGAIDREGYRGMVFYDGPDVSGHQHWLFDGWTYKHTGGPMGSRRAGWSVLREVADSGENCLLLEDDVMPVPGGIRTMLETEVPSDALWVSFFDSRKRLPREPGVFLQRADQFSGSLAMMMPVKTAREVLANNPWDFDHPSLLPLHDWDRALGLFCVEKWIGSYYRLRRPSLVEHRGDVTSTNSQRRKAIKAAWLEGAPEAARPARNR